VNDDTMLDTREEAKSNGWWQKESNIVLVPNKREKQIYGTLFAFHGRCGKQKQQNPSPPGVWPPYNRIVQEHDPPPTVTIQTGKPLFPVPEASDAHTELLFLFRVASVQIGWYTCSQASYLPIRNGELLLRRLCFLGQAFSASLSCSGLRDIDRCCCAGRLVAAFVAEVPFACAFKIS